MVYFNKKYIIRIPKGVTVYCHSDKTKLLCKSFRVKTPVLSNFEIIFLNDHKNNFYLYVSSRLLSDYKRNNINQLRLATVFFIKRLFSESVNTVCIKLRLVGVGYKVFYVQSKPVLFFKLGYSHGLYFKIPFDLKVAILHSNILIISGTSIEKVTYFASFLKSYRVPEPYKGKGVLYLNEKINFKIGKKFKL